MGLQRGMLGAARPLTGPPKLKKPNNRCRRHRRQLFLSAALVHEWLALEEVEDGLWSIWFYDVLVGHLDERLNRITV